MSPDDTRTLLRLQRELLALSPENRKALLIDLLEGANGETLAQRAQVPRERALERRKPPKKQAGRKGVKGSIPELALRIVFAHPEPVWSAEVLKEVLKFRPDVKPVNVYAALHAAAEHGRLFKEMVGNKARYSRPQGGKRQPIM